MQPSKKAHQTGFTRIERIAQIARIYFMPFQHEAPETKRKH